MTVDDVAALFYVVVGEPLGIWTGCGTAIVELPRDDRWQALSRRALLEDVETEHRSRHGRDPREHRSRLRTGDTRSTCGPAGEADRGRPRARASSTTSAAHGVYDLATLSVALREIRSLV